MKPTNEETTCPKCGKPMENKGNVDRRIFATYPPCWNDTYVCEDCKVKKSVFHSNKIMPEPDYKDYEEIK